MKHDTEVQKERRLEPAPTGVFVVFVGGVCLALAASGVYTVATLNRLEAAYLENRAQETAMALSVLARGPGRRTAEELGISLRTLQYRLRDYGLSGHD